ncbi:hypothetical protein QEN19_001802 [Hanseniaspora menglaensis]
MSSEHATRLLNPNDGYAIVVGFSAFFCSSMIFVSFCLKKYKKEVMTSENFATAGRSIGKFLSSSSVVSSWTWASTLLTSSALTYQNGIGSAYAYAAGAALQLVCFAALAVTVKIRAPNLHTYLELVRVRYGKLTHGVFITYALMTNILVTVMLVTGVIDSINVITGANIVGVAFLLPLGILCYTFYGGLKSTFLGDMSHSIIVVIVILMLLFKAYCVGYDSETGLGTPGLVYEALKTASAKNPVSGNKNGEMLTFHSKSSFIFFVINIAGNFGTVFLDQGYWNKAISTSAENGQVFYGYYLGFVAWMVIPLAMGTGAGLVCKALELSPKFPTYPNPMSSDQVSAGFVVPFMAQTLLGKNGAYAIMIMLISCFSSALSGELVAVSSVCAYDIYKVYINPKATGKQLIKVTHLGCVTFCVVLICFGISLHYGDVGMGWIYEFMGVVISSCVIPCVLVLFWKDMNVYAATLSPIISTLLALMAWLSSTKGLFGTVNVNTLFFDNPMLIGNLVCLLGPLIFIPIFQLIFGKQNFDFKVFETGIIRDDDSEELLKAELEIVKSNKTEIVDLADENSSNVSEKDVGDLENNKIAPINSVISYAKDIPRVELDKQKEENMMKLKKLSKIANWASLFFCLVLCIIWPMPMYGIKGYIWSKGFFTGWVVIIIIWMFISAFIVVVGPVWEGRHSIWFVLKAIYWDMTGQSQRLVQYQLDHPQELIAVQSQVDKRMYETDSIPENIDEIVEH